MWRARLSWRSPPRLSLCRCVWPLEAGIGANHHRVAHEDVQNLIARRLGRSRLRRRLFAGGLLR